MDGIDTRGPSPHDPGDAFRRADAVFDAALDLAPHDRSGYVARACGDDTTLRAVVERLLAAHDSAERFLETPAAALGATLLDEADDGACRPGLRDVPVPARVGAYRIVREVGRGGMGTVHLAERDDGQFRQRVALKFARGAFADDWMMERFLAERRILASLEHPHIARLYDGGTAGDGTPWFAMEYVEGEPLDAYCRAHALSLRARLDLFRDVLDAVAYAHTHGVVHRDLKPSNVMVTLQGVPKLLDFGIARLLEPGLDGDAPRTRTGLHLMTPEYAAPEQVRGAPVTIASDVYSLGVMLYEISTGERPYRLAGRTPAEIERVVCDTEPARPSAAMRRGSLAGTSGAGVDTADLDVIVLTAMHKSPARRYPSAGALLADLTRLAEGQPILARPDSALYRTRKLLVRRRAAASGTAAAIALVGVAMLGADRIGIAREPRVPSLLAAGVIHARDRLIVADFANHAADSSIAAAVTEAVRIDLAQSSLVRVLTPRQVGVTLSRMQQASDVALDDSLAREVAARDGVKAIVTGSVSRTGGAYTVSVELVDAVGGDALAAFRETASDSSALILAVDRVSKRLRETLGESLRGLPAAMPLGDVTTPSLPALRLYSAAVRRERVGDRVGAIRLHEQAIAIDSAFSAAHVGLAVNFAALAETGRSEAARRRALAHQDRLSYLDRNLMIASTAYGASWYDSASRTYRRVLQHYPDEIRALNNLALIHRDRRDYAVAESLFLRAIRVDSTVANLYFGVHDVQLLDGRYGDARRTLDLVTRRFPGNPVVGTIEVQHASAQQDWAAAERAAQAKLVSVREDPLESVDPYEALAGIAMTQGRLGEAERLWKTHFTVSEQAGSPGRLLFGVVQRAHLALRYRTDTAAAVGLVDSMLRRFPLDSLLPGDRPYDELARFHAAAGAVARARSLVAGADSNDALLGREQRANRQWSRGVLALAEGRAALARRLLLDAAASHVCALCPLPALGRASEAARHPDAALDAYERYLQLPWYWRYESDAVELGFVLQRVTALRAARGDLVGAARARASLDTLWRAADPSLRATLSRVR